MSSYQKFHLGEQLTSEQLDFFNTNGFIHFKNFITTDTVQRIVEASKKVEKRWLEDGIKKVNGVPVKYGTDLDGATIVQRFAFINQHHDLFRGLTEDPRFEALLQLVGPDARLGVAEKDGMVFNHYVNSSQSAFTKMGWHTDGLRDIFHGTKLNPMLNVGIHLDSLTEAHGGLRVLPGTHRQGIYQMLFRKKYFLDHKADEQEIAVIPEAGDLTVHDGRLWHRVAQSTVVGEASRRRVIYLPLIAGKYEPKNENSPTVFYQKFAGIVK
jgi:phytanoyl-CoA hydroxylase